MRSALKGLIISSGVCGQLGAIPFFLHIYIYICIYVYIYIHMYFLNEAAFLCFISQSPFVPLFAQH